MFQECPCKECPSLETKLPLNYLNHARIEETKLMRSSIKHSFTQKRAFLAGKNITCAGLLQAASISFADRCVGAMSLVTTELSLYLPN